MWRFIVLIGLITLALAYVFPETYDTLKDGTKAVLGIKKEQIKEDIKDLKIETINGIGYLSVGQIQRECTTDDECLSYNPQCDKTCVCRNGFCFKRI